MNTRVQDRVREWSTRPFSGGHAGLRDLADEEFSGVVETADGPWLCLLNGKVVGLFGARMETLEDAEGTAYVAPDPALPLLFAMWEQGGTLEEQYYTKDTPISEADATLSSGSFAGYVELSDNVLSGDYYLCYYGDRSMSVAFVGSSDRLVTGDEAFERADDEVGIYDVYSVDLSVTEVPDPDPEPTPAAGGGPGKNRGEPGTDDRSDPLSTGGTDREGDDAETGDPRGANRPDAADGRSAAERTGTGTARDAAGDRPDGPPPTSRDYGENDGRGADDGEGGSGGRPPGGADDPVRGERPRGRESSRGGESPRGREPATPDRNESRDGDRGDGRRDRRDGGTGGGHDDRTGTDRDDRTGGGRDDHTGDGRVDHPTDGRDGRTDDGRGGHADGDPTGPPESGRTDAPSGRGDDAGRADARSVGDANDAGSPDGRPSPERRPGDGPDHAGGNGDGRPTTGGESGPRDDRRPARRRAGVDDGPSGATADRRGRGPGDGDRDESAPVEDPERLRGRIRRHEATIESLQDRLAALEDDRRDGAAATDRLRNRVEDLAGDLGELRRTVVRLDRTVERLETDLEGGGSPPGTQETPTRSDAGRESGRGGPRSTAAAGDGAALSPTDALAGTTLLVRYSSQGNATLKTAHAGEADRSAVDDNLRIETKTSFDDAVATVDGRPFQEFLTDRLEYRCFEWLVRDLLYEIRDTGNADALRDLYDAVPRIDRAEFGGEVVPAGERGDGDGDGEPVTFDLVVRDDRENPLVALNFHESRDPASADMVERLQTDAEAAFTAGGLNAAFLVTTCYFDGAARESAEAATGGTLLSRNSKKGYVSVSRKRGFHLCLVDVSEGDFHLKVPEL